MNKDQKLLEEAYQSIYESSASNFVFLEEEEAFVEVVSRFLFNILEESLETHSVDKSNDGEPLFDFCWDEFTNVSTNPTRQAVSEINLSGIDKASFGHLYGACVERELEKYTRLKIVNGKLFFAFENPLAANFPLSSNIELVSFQDEQLLEAIRKYLKLHIVKSFTDPTTLREIQTNETWNRVWEWRKKRIAGMQVDKQLSKDFNVSALEGFE